VNYASAGMQVPMISTPLVAAWCRGKIGKSDHFHPPHVVQIYKEERQSQFIMLDDWQQERAKEIRRCFECHELLAPSVEVGRIVFRCKRCRKDREMFRKALSSKGT
jgi:hypothetical protein